MRPQDHAQEAKKHGVGSEVFKPAKGESKVRVLSEFEVIATHFFGKGQKAQNCTMDKDTCSYCKNDHKRSVKTICYIVDREDEEVKLAEMPWSFYKELGILSAGSEYGFADIPPYDVIITKTGEGLDTEYKFNPGKNEAAITDEQTGKYKNMKPLLAIVAKRVEKAQADNGVSVTPEENTDGLKNMPEASM